MPPDRTSSWWTNTETDAFAARATEREAERLQQLEEQEKFIADVGWTCPSCQRINGNRSWCLRCGEAR
jgi:hypothetical protein